MGKNFSLATNVAFNIAKAYRKGPLPDGSSGARWTAASLGFFSLECRPNNSPRGCCREASEVPSEQIRRGRHARTEFRRFVEGEDA